VISGRAYARELQVLRNMGLPPEVLETLSDEELTGYVFRQKPAAQWQRWI
jgi:hypothetical protein